jgi:3'(2'), 5'-bisphosphate nucleotidase
MTEHNDHGAIAQLFAQICLNAAIPVMKVYSREFTTEQKADKSPVTEADSAAEALILAALAQSLPDLPVIAEESFSAGVVPEHDGHFILVDPVDGTREFIAKNGEFTINIALVENGLPVAGAVYAPALSLLYYGASTAFRLHAEPGDAFDPSRAEAIACRKRRQHGCTAVISRSHADSQTRAFIDAQGVDETISAGSSLKFCRVAEGSADLYPRFGPTMEWDTAAGQAVIAAAGGCVTEPNGAPFRYGKADEGYRNGPFIVWADPDSAPLEGRS